MTWKLRGEFRVSGLGLVCRVEGLGIHSLIVTQKAQNPSIRDYTLHDTRIFPSSRCWAWWIVGDEGFRV